MKIAPLCINKTERLENQFPLTVIRDSQLQDCFKLLKKAGYTAGGFLYSNELISELISAAKHSHQWLKISLLDNKLQIPTICSGDNEQMKHLQFIRFSS